MVIIIVVTIDIIIRTIIIVIIIITIIIIVISFTVTIIIIFTIVSMGLVDLLYFADPNSCPHIAPKGTLYSLMQPFTGPSKTTKTIYNRTPKNIFYASYHGAGNRKSHRLCCLFTYCISGISARHK